MERLGALRLALHPGKSRIYTLKEGIEFLGFRHLPGRVRVRKENTRRFRDRMRRLEHAYETGQVTRERVNASLVSWCAHASYADSVGLRRKLLPGLRFPQAVAHGCVMASPALVGWAWTERPPREG